MKIKTFNQFITEAQLTSIKAGDDSKVEVSDQKTADGKVISAQEIFPVGGEKYPVGGVNAVLRRYFNRSVGAEVSLDWIQKQSILMYHEDVPKTQLEIMQIGVFAGYLLPLDKLHLLF